MAVFILAKSILVPIVLASFLASATWPLFCYVNSKLKNKVISASLILLSFLLLFAGMGLLVFSEARSLYTDLPNISGNLSKSVSDVNQYILEKTNIDISSNVSGDKLTELISSSSQMIEPFINNLTDLFSILILVPIYIFCIFIYQKQLLETIRWLTRKLELKYRSVLKSFNRITQSYIKGIFIVTSILSVLFSTVLVIIDVPYSVLLGFTAGICCIVPYVGVTISGILIMTISYTTQGSINNLIIIFVSFGFIQFVEGNFLSPKILGSTVNINPAVAIISLLIGFQIWGIVGMIIAIPTAAILKNTLNSFKGSD